jgi:hypothetical protein
MTAEGSPDFADLQDILEIVVRCDDTNVPIVVSA